jgi:L-2-hydroxyglutarate oxidase LhgO
MVGGMAKKEGRKKGPLCVVRRGGRETDRLVKAVGYQPNSGQHIARGQYFVFRLSLCDC